jgi:ferredoxin
MTTIRVSEHCAGLGVCVAIAPEIFVIVDDQATASAVRDADQAELAAEAAESCPMQAIEIA